MSKKAFVSRRAANEAVATASSIRTSYIKLNLVAQLIRGLRVQDALTQLTFSSKRIAVDVRKTLQSAIANAENNHNLNVDDLVVAEAFVGKNIVMKRLHTRGRGRAARVLKPFSNITIVLREQTGEAKGKKPKKSAKAKPEGKGKAQEKQAKTGKPQASKAQASKSKTAKKEKA